MESEKNFFWNWIVCERDFSFHNDIKATLKSTRKLSNWNTAFIPHVVDAASWEFYGLP